MFMKRPLAVALAALCLPALLPATAGAETADARLHGAA